MVRKCPHCGARHPKGTVRCTATGRPIAGDPEMVGKVIQDRYHLVRLLGDGGMGAVYKAADRVLRRFVAIKLLHPAVAQNASSVERFQREARAAASIGHPNIIDILDFGDEGGRPFMVMEYLRGRSLSHVIAMDGQLTIKRACTIAVHTLAGLHAAHVRGILHRDLKPANLMLVVRFGDRNYVKVCDFGFAALVQAGRTDSKSLTPERTLVGTPAYAAPERLRGDDRRDPRLDVYSIGVVLYEMLAGRRPFDAPTFRELARKVRKEPPTPLRERRPDLPVTLERVVMRALAKDREERWDDAESFAEALFPFGGVRAGFHDDQPSESFTMEMMRIKARETRHRETHSGPAPQPPKVQAPELAPRIERPKISQPPPPPKAPLPPAHTTAGRRKARGKVSAPPKAQLQPKPQPKPRAKPKPSGREEDETARMSNERAAELMEKLEGSDEYATKVGTPSGLKQRRESEDADRTMVDKAPAAIEALRRARSGSAEDLDSTERGSAPPPDPAPRPHVTTSEQEGRGYYNGRLVLATLRFISRKFGERALKDLLDSMPEEHRAPFVHGIDEDSWVSLVSVKALIEKADARLGDDDLHLVLEAGRAAAEGAFDMMRDLRPPTPPPELLVSEMPKIINSVIRGVDLQVRRVGRGYGRLEMVEREEPSLTLAVGTLGFIARSLERFGADDVEVNLLSARALDDPQTLIDISWFA